MRKNMWAERERKGYTIKEVSKKVGVHPNAVRKWEKGLSEPTASNMIALCHLYGCSAEYLMDMTDKRDETAVAE